MSYVAPYLDESGLHLPTYAEVLQHMTDKYKEIFGDDVYLGEDTQDYQLLSLYASLWDDLSTVLLDSYNARNVNWASGTALDSIAAFSGIKRLSATYSTVTLKVTGTAGTTLSAGVTARDLNGYSWETQADCVFDDDGSAVVSAKCTTAGNITAEAGTITVCQTPTYNWTAVTNESPATAGSDAETDAELRERRAKSLFGSSASSLDALVSALRNIDNVTAVKVSENNTGETDDNGIPAHSICCIVEGGANADIAEKIYFKRSPGIGTYGTTSYAYTDQWGQSNTIKFSRPSTKAVAVRVDITALDGFDSVSTPAKIKTAITEYIENIDIGVNLTVPYLYAQAYAVNDGTPTFVITSATANNLSSVVQADFDSHFTVSGIEVNIT